MDSNNEKLMEDNVGQVELGSQSPPIEDELAANFPNALSTQDPLVVFTDESDDDETKNDKSDKIGDIFHDGPSSDSEHENDDSNEKGHVLNSMFGEDSDSDLGRKSDAETIPDNQKSDEEATLGNGNTSGILVDGREWDFDVMMRQKKAARRKHKRKRDAGIDIINDDDYAVSTLVEEMKAATRDDCRSNQERQPALRKRMLLSEVKLMFLKVDSIETLIDNGMMSAVSDWLSPLPDKSLPGLEVRTELLKLLQSFTRLEPGCLKQSGLGKAVMMLFKHPRETKQNKELANKLIREWSRPIFQLNDDFRSLSREERVERDLKNMPAIKKQRVSEEESVDLTEPGCSTSSNFGSKSYVGRARVPRPSSKDYVLRPKYNVDGQFKGERKSSASYQLDKIQRDFMERARKNKTRRAVRVSVEGKNMDI